MTQAITVRSRVAPRGLLDAVISLGVALVMFSVLVFAPAAVLAWWVGSPVAFVLFVSGYWIVWVLFSVPQLEVSSEGIRFVRKLGTPKFLPWSEIESVEPAPRTEILIHGWLWPRFPLRDMSPGHTSLGYFRIRFNGGVAYFPPRDEARFSELIRNRGQALAHDASSAEELCEGKRGQVLKCANLRSKEVPGLRGCREEIAT